MKNNIDDSEALKRVWIWKEEIYNEVKNLDIREQLKKIHEMAEKIESAKLFSSK